MCDQTYLILTLVDSSSFMAVSAFYSSCDASCFQLVKKSQVYNTATHLKQWMTEINFGMGYIALQIAESLYTLKLDCQLNEDKFSVTTQENKPVQTNRPQMRQSARLGEDVVVVGMEQKPEKG